MGRSGLFWGIVLVSLGILFLLGNMGYLEFTLGRLLTLYWPLALIYIGVRMVAKTYGRFAWSTIEQTVETEPARLISGRAHLYARHVLGDLHIVVDREFKGGAVQVGLGDLEIDLRTATVPDGTWRLECISRVGRVRVRPPEQVSYLTTAFCLAGDVVTASESKDGFVKTIVYASPDYHDSTGRLEIIARSGLGSVIVR